MLTIREAAEKAKISQDKLRREIETGAIAANPNEKERAAYKAAKSGPGRPPKTLIREKDLERYIAARTKTAGRKKAA